MGGLAHFIEEEGVPTTQISLIREHTEIIKPPRALWVSFELGRPLGVSDDTDFQTRVLTAALNLLEAPSGPVLADYAEDAPPVESPTALVCPVDFSVPTTDQSDVAQLSAKFIQELVLMRPWYDLSVSNSKRTTVGVSGMEPETFGSFVAEFLEGSPTSSPDNPNPAAMFKLAAEDLKAYYFEAATARPGQEEADSDTLSQWFWRDTVAGNVLFTVRNQHQDSEDKNLRQVVNNSLVPRTQRGYSPFDTNW